MRVDELLPADVLDAAAVLTVTTGHDVLRSADFWESWVAVQLGGSRTEHKAAFDVSVEIWGRPCRAEVKFSNAFWSNYAPIRGTDWSRHCFRWAVTKPQIRTKAADAYVLLGLDLDRTIACWVIPTSVITANHYTVCVPSERIGANGRLDKWQIDPGQMLPAFAACCHNKWDAPHRKVNAARTRRSKSPQLDMEDFV